MRQGRPAVLLLAALLCALPGRAFALKTERLARFSVSAGGAADLEVAAGLAFVRFSAGVSTSAAAAALSASGFSLFDRAPHGGWYLVGLPASASVAWGLSALKGFSFVSAAEPDKVYRLKRVPDDAFLARQYALAQVQAFGAWEYETGLSSRVTVAVIDTGVESTHPDLADKFTDSTNQFCDPGADKLNSGDNIACGPEIPAVPACYHGTSVAGVAAGQGNNAVGISGVSWGAKLVSIKVFRNSDCVSGCSLDACGTDDKAMIDALVFLAGVSNTPAYGKIVANLSLGCPNWKCGSCSDPLKAGVKAAVDAGVMVFAAAGNGGDSFIDTPANCPGVIAVGATDFQDKLAGFSTTDSTMTTKGLTAPGVDIFTTDLNGGYASVSGTSFSAPMAAGLAALLWSAKPLSSPAEIFTLMRNSADDLGPAGPDRSFGGGRINALKAMRLAMTGSSRFAGTGKAVAYPNPFRPKTQRLATFSIPDRLLASGVEVKIYTSEGELVKKLDSLAWDGRNEAGAAVASGVYVFRIKTDKDSAVGKMALIR